MGIVRLRFQKRLCLELLDTDVLLQMLRPLLLIFAVIHNIHVLFRRQIIQVLLSRFHF